MTGSTSGRTKGTTVYGRVIDGALKPPIEDGAVVLEGERIAWVGARAQLPKPYGTPDYEQVDLPGRSVLPGLIDCHTHVSFGEARSEEELALYTPIEYRVLKAAHHARKILQAGVTSAFDAATTYNIAPCLRDAIDVGLVEGPRFAVCGRQLTTHQGLEDSFPNEMQFPPGQAGVLIRSKEELVEAIRYQVKDRVDAIKISGSNDSAITPGSLDGSAWTYEELKIIADETHRLGRLAATHARSRVSIVDAARAGFDIICHASHIDDEGIEACLRNNCVINPTLTFLFNLLNSARDGHGAPFLSETRKEVEAAKVGLRRAHEAGIPMVCGSESGWSPVPYGQWHAYELQIFVEHLGFTPLEAIHSATLGATRCLQRFGDLVGRLEPGRYADVVVINGNPLEDITVLQKKSKLDRVFKGGRVVDLTPPAPRKEWFFEQHRLFLNGRWHYDEATGDGVLLA